MSTFFARDLPELEQARYVLLDGQLHGFELGDDAHLKLEPEAKAAGPVWLAYSEHPWSAKQRSAVDAGGKRDR